MSSADAVPSTDRPGLPSQVSPPEFALSATAPHAILGAEVVAVAVLPGDPGSTGDADQPAPLVLGPGAGELADQLGIDLLGVLELSRATGAAGEVTSVPVPLGGPDNADLRCVLLVGVGRQRLDDFRRAGAALARATTDRSSVATSVPAIAPDGGVEAFVVGAMLGSFAFHWRSHPPEQVPVRRIVLAGLPDTESFAAVLDRAVAVGGAGWRSRMLSTVPSNLKNPPWMAEQAAELARESGLELTVWDEKRLAAEGFGGILGVGQASVTPPRLIRLDYTPPRADRHTSTVALVGKGITFDTGGLSIKPSEAMVNMKRDMTGGAVVMATMAALGAVGCPVRVVGLVAAAENSVSGNALRPGDVVRHYGGRTSEVTNTDAEGRRLLRQRRGARDGAARGGGDLRRAAVALPADRRLRVQAGLERRRRRQRPRWTGRDHGGPVPPALRRRPALGPPRHRLGRRLAVRVLRVDHRPHRLRRPRAAAVAGLGEPAGRRRMNGLTVRWSLADAPAGVEEELASYVEGTSHARFTGMSGLRFKTWRCSPGAWFEGCYVFVSDEARAEFQATFTATAAEAPGSTIIGSPPILIEACEIVAVAEGWDGFLATPRA
jgi:leucyl aminopeptidase